MRPTPSIPFWEPASVFLVTLVALAVFVPRITTYLDPVTGDEPFYLMTAISMWEDHDLNECNNYRQREELRFYPSFYSPWTGFPQGWKGWTGAPFPLPPHAAHIVPASRMCASTDPSMSLPADGSHSELYTKHGIGLSLLVMLPFELGGRALVVYFLCALGALLAANIYLLAREATGDIVPALLTWLAFAFTVPLMPYSYLIFPELPAALFILYAFRRIRLWHNNWLQTTAISLSISFLPWLHYRFVPVCAALILYFVYKLFRYRSQGQERTFRWASELALFAVPILASAALLMAYFYQRYGQVTPNPADHAGSSDLAGTLRGAAGLLLDEQWGLFVYAPVYILTIVGVVLMAVRRDWRGQLGWLGLVFVPYYGVIANYAQWWGEWCPPARYLASTLPLLALPFAIGLHRIRSALYDLLYGALFALSLLVMAGFLYQPQWMYHQPDGKSLLITRGLPELLAQLPFNLPAGSIADAISSALPSFVLPYFAYLNLGKEGGDTYAALAWSQSLLPGAVVMGIVVLGLLLAWRTRRTAQPPPPPSQPLPEPPYIPTPEVPVAVTPSSEPAAGGKSPLPTRVRTRAASLEPSGASVLLKDSATGRTDEGATAAQGLDDRPHISHNDG